MTPTPEELIQRADAVGVRLELVRGLAVWEASPNYRHQREVDRIRASIRPGTTGACSCEHVGDVLFRFPDGSLKRPDIAVLCEPPDEAEQDGAITVLPGAVIEIVSAGYEAKDLDLAPGFYLGHGVRDVVVFDPRTQMVLHHRRDGVRRLTSPHALALECGCTCMV